MRATRMAAAAAAIGLVLGLALVIVGVPYGRANLTAFAELYHGPTDTTGEFHLALDCNTAQAGTQDNCSVNAFMIGATIDVDLTIGNSTGGSVVMSAFGAVVESLDPLLSAQPAASCSYPYLECSPDFLDIFEAANGIVPTGWNCGGPLPSEDYSGEFGDQSLISCAHPFSSQLIEPGATHRQLARIRYDVAGVAQDQSAGLTIELGNVYDELGNELMTCAPVITVPGSCFGATITAIGHVFPTPTWTSTPIPDQDGDGVLDASDNCPAAANPLQENANANFIGNAPHYVVNDFTRILSDGEGDACDVDDDGDTLPDAAETPTPPCSSSSGATNPLNADTDGDRAVDAAECALGFNPTNAGNKPTAAQCGTTSDVDGDRLQNRVEVCGYGSDPADNDSDNDGVRDGCEAVSLNTDQAVNSGDQLLLAQEIVRRLAGGAPHVNFDANKDGNANSGDQLLMAYLIIPSGQCP